MDAIRVSDIEKDIVRRNTPNTEAMLSAKIKQLKSKLGIQEDKPAGVYEPPNPMQGADTFLPSPDIDAKAKALGIDRKQAVEAVTQPIAGAAQVAEDVIKNVNKITQIGPIDGSGGLDESYTDAMFGSPETQTGVIGRQLGRVATTMAGYASGYGVAKLIAAPGTAANVVSGGVGSFVVDALAFDPKEERLSDIAVKNDWAIAPMAKYLAHDKDTQNDGLEMIKNGTEGLALGTTIGTALEGVLGMYKLARGARGSVKDISGFAEDSISGVSKINVEFGAGYKPPQGIIESLTDVESRSLDAVRAKVAKEMADVGAPRTVQDVQIEATKIAQDERKIFELFNKGKNPSYTANEVKAMEMHVNGRFDDIYSKTQEYALRLSRGEDVSKGDLVKFNLALIEAVKKDIITSAAKGEAGRTLRMLQEDFGSVLAGDAPKVAAEVLDLLGGEDQVRQILKTAAELDPKQLRALGKQVQGRDIAGAIKEVWRIGMISGVNTAVKNTISGGLTMAGQLRELKLAANIAKKAGDTASASDYMVRYTAAQKELYERLFVEMSKIPLAPLHAARVMFGNKGKWSTLDKDFYRMERQVTQSLRSRIDIKDPKFTAAGLGLSPESAIGRTADVVGAAGRMSGLLVAASDNAIDNIAYHMNLRGSAMLDGLKRGLEGAQLEDHVQNIFGLDMGTLERLYKSGMATPDDIKYLGMLKEASDYADKTKYLNQPQTPGGKVLYDNVIKGKWLFGKWAPLDITAPFARNAIAMAEYGYERSIFNYLSPKSQQIMQLGGPEAHMLKAKLAYGNQVLALGVMAGLSGTIVGTQLGGVKREMELADAGIVRRSFEVNGRSIPLDGLGVWSNILTLGADIANIGKWGAETAMDKGAFGVEYSKLIGATVAALAEAYTPEDLTRAVRDITEYLQDPQDSRYTGKTATGIAGSVVPRIVQDVKDVIDPIKRDTGVSTYEHFSTVRGMLNRLTDSTPGISKTLPKAVDVFGHTIKDRRGVISSIFNAATGDGPTPAMAEIVRLGLYGPLVDPETSPVKHLVIRKPQREITYSTPGLSGYSYRHPLNGEQYYVYSKLSAGYTDIANVGGKIVFKEKVGGFEREVLAAVKTEKNDEKLRIKIRKIRNEYESAARKRMLELYPEIDAGYNEYTKEVSSMLGEVK